MLEKIIVGLSDLEEPGEEPGKTHTILLQANRINSP